ncbi:glutamate--cysteine ligase [Enemella sp. A6]|uniref:glutamate--cysteine ligase n=1 Tax=Enemella sp. A6 TaxID=3440152 RepID=UPI003EBCDB47
MGEEIGADSGREHRRAYRRKVQECLDVFESMLVGDLIMPSSDTIGLEIELNLVDADGRPAMRNADALAEIADADFVAELGRYNIELNVPPRTIDGGETFELENSLRNSLNAASRAARELDMNLVMIGILPTLRSDDLTGAWMSDSARFAELNDSIFSFRGEDMEIDITGPGVSGERLRTAWPDIAPESACTSAQLHLQVAPEDFARYWNAAQAFLGPQVAVAANSPFFLGRRLWAETRVELFHQAIDTRPPELRNQGVRPRVFFGDRWITSIFDLLDENVRYFPSLLPELTDEDPRAELAAGRAPQLRELRLHNGTVYRWNRPVYDVVDDMAHVRVENRVLPAGPSVIDTLANASFYYGVVRALADAERPVWSTLSFSTAEQNFRSCAQRGLEASVLWPSAGEIGVAELVLEQLLGLAAEGLDAWGVRPAVRDRYLNVIEERTRTGRNGAWWQTRAVERLESRGLSRELALTEMLAAYRQGMDANEPVHTWPLP